MAWKDSFRKFLDADPERLHFAAHSHHFWPDVTFEAHQRAWHDAARLADEKWEMVFAEVLPEAQRHIAAELSLPHPESIVFAPNTHELVLRLLSCLGERPRVVTTDSEFHSFERQTRRLEEEGLLEVVRVPSEPFATFPERLSAASKGAQLVFFSQVFFNSGAAKCSRSGSASRNFLKPAFQVMRHLFPSRPFTLSKKLLLWGFTFSPEASANFSSSSRCLCVRFCGVSTTTRTC